MKKTYHRGELYYADLGTGIGSEQNGYRPVVGDRRKFCVIDKV